MTISPSEERIREKGIMSFDRHWYTDVRTHEIKHHQQNGWLKLLGYLWYKKHPVEHLYWWSSRKWATSEMMPIQQL